jgi:hypothetical protein
VRAHDGALTVTATGSGFSDTATLELPATGWTTAGRTALYNVGGTGRLAIVTIVYGTTTSTAPPVQMIRDKLVLLPVGSSGQIDEPFPKQVRTNRIGTVRQHICHVDLEAKRVGCPGAFAD